MRKQYHFRPGAAGLTAWDVDRLIELTADQPEEDLALDAIAEIDQSYWFSHGAEPTVRAVVDHLRLLDEVEPSIPIIVDPDGGVMDGMHRVAKALLAGQTTIRARRLREWPAPDFVGVRPQDLPYD